MIIFGFVDGSGVAVGRYRHAALRSLVQFRPSPVNARSILQAPSDRVAHGWARIMRPTPQKQGLGGCRRREQRPAERQGRIVCGNHDHGLGPVGEEDPGAFVPRLHRRPDVRGRIIMQPRWAGSNAATPSGYEMACFVVLKCDLGNRHRPLADLSARPDRIPDLAVILIYLTYLMF